jgi:hypothetical protein
VGRSECRGQACARTRTLERGLLVGGWWLVGWQQWLHTQHTAAFFFFSSTVVSVSSVRHRRHAANDGNPVPVPGPASVACLCLGPAQCPLLLAHLPCLLLASVPAGPAGAAAAAAAAAAGRSSRHAMGLF